MKKASQELINLLHGSDEFLMADLFTITLASGEVLRYTNADIDVSWNSGEFKGRTIVISRGATRITRDLEADINELSIAATSDHKHCSTAK